MKRYYIRIIWRKYGKKPLLIPTKSMYVSEKPLPIPTKRDTTPKKPLPIPASKAPITQTKSLPPIPVKLASTPTTRTSSQLKPLPIPTKSDDVARQSLLDMNGNTTGGFEYFDKN